MWCHGAVPDPVLEAGGALLAAGVVTAFVMADTSDPSPSVAVRPSAGKLATPIDAASRPDIRATASASAGGRGAA